MSEGVGIAALLGTPESMVPASTADVRDYFDRVESQLCVSADAREAIDFVVNPPVSRELLPYWPGFRLLGQAAVAIVPRPLRRLAGIDRPRAVDLAAIAAVRPLVAASRLPPLRALYGAALGSEVRAVHLEELLSLP